MGGPGRIPSGVPRMQWLPAQPGSIGWCGCQVLPRLFYIARGPARGVFLSSSELDISRVHTQVPGAYTQVRTRVRARGGTPPNAQTGFDMSDDLTSSVQHSMLISHHATQRSQASPRTSNLRSQHDRNRETHGCTPRNSVEMDQSRRVFSRNGEDTGLHPGGFDIYVAAVRPRRCRDTSICNDG